MKVCQRCGEQTVKAWQLHVSTVSEYINKRDYEQVFYVCADCRQQVFDRLSKVLTDAPKWKPAVEPETTD